jgi:YegS/Rv2252/BmrU family lipid kinase
VDQVTLAIVNPAAGGGRCAALAPRALERLAAAGLTVEEQRTGGPGDARRIAREAYAKGVRRFLAVGGDGTAYEIVNGLLPEALAAGERARPSLGFLPLGTGNSFLRDFGDRGPEDAAQALAQDRRRGCDVLRLVHDSGTLYSLNLISLGFVADVATTANHRFKRLGIAGYVLGVVLRTAALKAHPLSIRIDGAAPWQQDVVFASFCNSRYTGGTMMMAPFADTSDGKLDVIVARAMSRTGLLMAFPRIFAGTHVHLPTITSSQAQHVDFDASEAIDLMIDGEVERHRPIRIETVPRALDVCV